MHRYLIDLAPAQIYSSALIFSPKNSVVRRTVETEINGSFRLPEVPGICSPSQNITRKSFGLESPEDIKVITQLPGEWSACIQILEGHSGWVTGVVFSPDGSRMVSSSEDQTVRVWDVQTGQCQHTLKGHSGTVSSVVFSPDGSLVASSSDDQTVRVWDIATGAELLCHDSHTCDNDIEFGDNSSNILINGQAINIPRHLPRATIATQSFSSNSASDGKLGIIGEWVMSRSQRILWLPPEYRPGSWASKNDALIIGSDNGRITFVYHTDVI
jgi:WD40 repeat protein